MYKRQIIDRVGLENLRGKGHGILHRGSDIKIQCPYLSTDHARELLQPTYVEKQLKTTSKNGDIVNFDFMEGIQ